MKKILLLLLCALCLSACSNKKITNYTEITYAELKQKIENKETFPLFIGSHVCPHCDDYKITLKRFVSNYQVEVFYLDVANMKAEEVYELRTLVNFSSTPTTAFMIDGEEKSTYDRIVGALPYSKVVTKFEKMGYIKEK